MARIDRGRGPRALLEHHGFTLFSSLGRLAARPLSAAITIAVIAIALALPTGFYLLIKNLQTLSDSWERLGEISLFLARDLPSSQAEALVKQFSERADISAARRISAEDALEEFRRQADLGDALATLQSNPLPDVIILTPMAGSSQPQIEGLAREAEALDSVDFAQFDMAWLIRFNAIVATVQRLIELVAGLLILGVLLIVGNIIRLDIENRREEIEITKMLGGTDAFIRRPFLYSGLWYGLFGGIMAWVLVVAALLALAGPVGEAATAYGSGFTLAGPGPGEALVLLGTAAVIGLLGAWLAVNRQLAEIQPT